MGSGVSEDGVCRRNAQLVLHECSVRGQKPLQRNPDKVHAGAASRGSRRPGGTASSQRRAPQHGCPGGAGNGRPGASLPAPGGAPDPRPLRPGGAADRAGGALSWAFFFRANFRRPDRPPFTAAPIARRGRGSRAGPQRTAPCAPCVTSGAPAMARGGGR